MITEDYVSFETAKLMKEKGFNWSTDKQFNLDKIVSEYNITDRSRYPERYLDAPTLQMAMKWLREVHNIDIIINVSSKDESYNERKYAYVIVSKWFTGTDNVNRIYEEACEAAIKYCLEKLI